ncbi:MAG: hypothetical protein GX649_06565 [Chloroflexi bacterium]|nr:hypothetical protein [Chloroflexota bacterium]
MDWSAQEALGRATGVVVPAYFSAAPPDDLVRRLLWMTLGDCHHYLPLEQVWVVVDGDERTARLAGEVQEALRGRLGASFHLVPLAENGGKFRAVREGARGLLAAHPDLRYIAVRDGDGDHAISDLPALLRAAEEIAAGRDDTNVLIAGARASRHHPMGWVRGELEAILDRVTIDALAYHLARRGRALDLAYVAGANGAPDLSSGYKVYGRQAAEYLFGEAPPQYASLSKRDYWRYGPETVPVVEAVLAGATLGEAARLTFNGQPTSSFGDFAVVALYGELLAWVWTRLGIPPDVAACLYDNAACRALLGTTAPGAETLDTVRRHALERTAAHCGGAPLPPPRPRPSFL